jgi:hypothetical protein
VVNHQKQIKFVLSIILLFCPISLEGGENGCIAEKHPRLSKKENTMIRGLFVVFLFVLPSVIISAQTVTVDPTNDSPNNISTFNSLQAAIHSFQASGALNVNGGITTDATGVGVNHGNAAADVINIATTAAIEEVVRIDSFSSFIPVVLDEPLTINGYNRGAEPSAANNSVVALGWSGDADGGDHLVIQQDVDITFNNLTLIPSATLAGGDELVFLSPASVSAITGSRPTFSFNCCVFTHYVDGATNVPIVQSKAEAYVDNRDNLGGPGGQVDAFFHIQPDVGEHIHVELVDCVLSHNQDFYAALFENAPQNSGCIINITSSVFSFNSAHGIWFFGGGVEDAPLAWQFNIDGDDAGAGPSTGLGGPSLFLGNGNHHIRSSLGPHAGECNIKNTIMANSGGSAFHGDNDAILNIYDSLFYHENGFDLIYDSKDDDSLPNEWLRSTFAGGQITLGASKVATGGTEEATTTVRDCIFYHPGGTMFGTASDSPPNNTYDINIDFCAIISATPGGTINTVFGSNILTDNPDFLSFNIMEVDFLDVGNSAYANGNSLGNPLQGGADYVPLASVDEWDQY